jgi:hypothetical protein
MKPLPSLSQAAKDEIIPVLENQGPVFTVGEILEMRGGRFRVHAITSKRLYLDSLPSRFAAGEIVWPSLRKKNDSAP